LLREKVEKYMMHSRDHLSHPGSHCNWNGVCIYRFPHQVQPTMSVDEHGRLHWRQRNAEDSWVVPYCPALLNFADCHFHFDVVYTANVIFRSWNLIRPGRMTRARPRLHYLESPLVCASILPLCARIFLTVNIRLHSDPFH
jgi:hypothetical protein